MSFGFKKARGLDWVKDALDWLFNCTPSTMNRGSLPALIEPTPRIRMLTAPPGRPLEDLTCTPDARPCNARSKDCKGRFWIASPFTEETAPVTSRFGCVPYPVTITSLKAVTSDSKATLIMDLLPMFTS